MQPHGALCVDTHPESPTMSYVFPPRAPSALPVAATVKLFPVRRVYCIGRNYAAHTREMGGNPDREPPFFFMKPGDAVQAAHPDKTARHLYPSGTSDYHHELELVAALRKGGRNIPASRAMDCVFGYAIGLDMTRRDRQAEAKKLARPWEIGKSGDNSAIVGQITPKAKAGQVLDAPLHLTVNGGTRQTASTADMIWSLPEQIAILSEYYTLAPGDLIMTGTPEGVNAVVKGDLMIGRIGQLPELRVRVA
jgi:fumarylpyruvate hydrolase